LAHNSKELVVEDIDAKHSIIHLVKAHVEWSAQEPYTVNLRVGKSVGDILNRDYVGLLIKERELRTLGFVLDADDNAAGRYQRCAALFREWFPAIPDRTTVDGVITENSDKRLGIWIMPDNVNAGDIETLLSTLVPENRKALWEAAVRVVREIRQNGSPCRDCHVAKANLFTWLAWQDPPGHAPGTAIRANLLDANAPPAEGFVRWFRRLYEL